MKNALLTTSLFFVFILLFVGSAEIYGQSDSENPCISDSLSILEGRLESRLKKGGLNEEKEKAVWENIFSAAKCLYKNGQYEEALNQLHLLEKHIDPTSVFPEHRLVELYELFGNAYSRLAEHRKSISYFEKALKFCPETSDKKQLKLRANLLYQIALGYYNVEDYLNATEYMQYALAVIKNNNLNSLKLEIKILKFLGDAYKYQKNYEESKRYYERGITLSNTQKNSVDRKSSLGLLFQRLGTMQYNFDHYEDAILSLQKSILFYSEIYGQEDIKVADAVNSLGNTYYYLKDYSKASKLYLATLEPFKKRSARTVADQYSKIGACHTNMGEFDKAAYYLEQSLATLRFDARKAHPFADYKSNRGDLLIILYFNAKNHQKAFEAGQGRQHLYEASRYFGLCMRYLEEIGSDLDESGSKTYFLDRFYYVIERAINNCYYLYQETDSLQYLDLAFGYAERSKALLLKEALRKADVAIQLHLPEPLLKRDHSLNQKIAALENQRYEARQAGDEARSHQLTSQIYPLKQSYNQLLDSIKAAYPAYAQFKEIRTPLSTDAVRARLLKPGQALLQYFAGEDDLFLFTFTAGACTLTKVKRDSTLSEAVEGFRESIYGWVMEREDSLIASYGRYGRQLYRQLIEPVADQLPGHLIIVPDGVLEYLPFEALLYGPPPANPMAFTDYPYLLNRYQISYAHSVNLLEEIQSKAVAPSRQEVLAFAPFFEDDTEEENSIAVRRSGLGRLFNNEEEVANIQHFLKASIRKREEATRARFLDEAPLYSIIHLATHAKANDAEGEYSYLAFTGAADTLRDERLYAKDLFNLRLQAEMVVLSACETGLGELRRGEGVISLARGFSQAGARSLITTLWRVSDRESSELMRLFYKGLAKGLPKDEALRQAKQTYLSAASSDRAHPFFWAAFVPTGDMSAIKAKRQGPGWWRWGLLVLGVAAFGWVLRSKLR
ncbi:MAG: CHAT domain-containing protein [Lewinellaceae bacterium]|nr:CHAT domain-containing protein [Lewinellaceae bacterium]